MPNSRRIDTPAPEGPLEIAASSPFVRRSHGPSSQGIEPGWNFLSLVVWQRPGGFECARGWLWQNASWTDAPVRNSTFRRCLRNCIQRDWSAAYIFRRPMRMGTVAMNFMHLSRRLRPIPIASEPAITYRSTLHRSGADTTRVGIVFRAGTIQAIGLLNGKDLRSGCAMTFSLQQSWRKGQHGGRYRTEGVTAIYQVGHPCAPSCAGEPFANWQSGPNQPRDWMQCPHRNLRMAVPARCSSSPDASDAAENPLEVLLEPQTMSRCSSADGERKIAMAAKRDPP